MDLRLILNLNFLKDPKDYFELSDKFKKLETICKCGKKAFFNARKINGKYVKDGLENIIDKENEETKYVPLCGMCYLEKVFK